MAQNMAAIRKGLASGSIPDTILKQIDDQEVLDRLAYAGELIQKANGASGTARRDLIQRARAVMQAQPRALTEREVKAAVAKSATLGNGLQADAARRRANELLEQNSPAPRRWDRTADDQARDAGPVSAGGTTGIGAPRGGLQRGLPGDVPGRQVIKAALPVVVYDRRGRMCSVNPARISQRIAKAAGR
jgi:hypothetical protein